MQIGDASTGKEAESVSIVSIVVFSLSVLYDGVGGRWIKHPKSPISVLTVEN